jgi:hypothetical protein
MALPGGFSPVEHFKTVCQSSYNRIVRDYFKDLDGNELDEDITTPRASLKEACLVDPTDSSILINNRMMLFYMVLRAAADLQAPIYGMPIGAYHELRKFKPQVCLYFKEDSEDVDEGYEPVRAEINFRLMGETETTVSKAELITLANKIKTEFGTGDGYRFHKGKTLCAYTEPDKGYSLQIYAYSSAEGKEVIAKVLDLQNHSPDWSKLTINENDSPASAYPTIPTSKVILGKSQRQPRKRPVAYVRFQRATCAIWGIPRPVGLYDRTNYLETTLADE